MMSPLTMRPGNHVADGVIVSLLDGESTIDSGHAVSHLATCAQCAARLVELRQESAALSGMLDELDVAMPSMNGLRDRLIRADEGRRTRHQWHRAGLRIAAGIVLAAGIASATPVGGMIARSVTSIFAGAEPLPITPSVPAAASGAATASTAIRFLPATDTLEVRFEHRPASGSLALSVSGDGHITAQVVGAESAEELLILPGVLRVRNTPGATTNFAVETPAGLHVVIVAGGDTVFAGGATEGGHRLQLGTDGRGPR